MKSFIQRNSYYNYANISLASFSKCKAPINEIEENIVQQLIYSTSSDRLPKSRLKRIYHTKNIYIFTATSFIFLLFISVFTFYTPVWPKEIDHIPKILQMVQLPQWLAGLIILASTFYLLNKLIRILFSFNIDKITVKAGPVEAEKSHSILHKNIDEILYFFERTKIDILTIEDLDRFESVDILSRLREINIIINSSPSITRPILFIYAINDSLFTSTDRTKFFDLIVPIVPIINSENSKEKFREILNRTKIGESSLYFHIGDDLIEHISYYVDDMRLLINICNELNLYSSILCKDIDIPINKLFSIIAIKNIYPKEHSWLTKNRGDFYELFKKKELIKIEKIDGLNKKIESLEQEIEESEKVAAKSINELRIIAWHHLGSVANIHNYTHIRINQSSYIAINEFISNEVFQNVFTHQYHLEFFRWTQQYGRYENVGQINSPYKTLNSKEFNYTAREALLKKDWRNKKYEVNKLKNEILLIKDYNIKDVIENIIDNKFREQYGLVVFLIRRGLFSEDYSDYLSYFYPGSLDFTEKNIILKIKEGHFLPETTEVRNVPIILSHIPPNYFIGGYGLIASIIQYLLNNENFYNKHANNTQYLQNILNINRNIDRLFRIYIALNEEQKNRFLTKMAQFNLSLISDLYEYLCTNEASAEAEHFTVNVLSSLSENNIDTIKKTCTIFSDEKINNLNNITIFYNNRSSTKAGWKWFWSVQHEFSSIEENSISEDHLSLIVEDSNYEINAHMVRLIISKLMGLTELKDLVSYKNVLDINNKYLLSNINENLSTFVEKALLTQETLDESEESLIALLNSEDVDDVACSDLIVKSNIILTSIKSISDAGLWITAIYYRKIGCSWKNVLDYHNYYVTDGIVMDDTLESYLKDPEIIQVLEEDQLPDDKEFIDSLLCNKNIPASSIMKLIGNVKLEIENIENENIPIDTMDQLIRKGKISFSVEILIFINSNFVELTSAYLLMNWGVFENDVFDEIGFGSNLIIDIIKSEIPKNNDKLEIIGLLEASDIESNISLSTAISELIIKAYTEENLTILGLDDEFLISLISNIDLTIDDRVKVLACTLDRHKWKTLNKILPCLKGSGFENLGSKKLSVSNNENNFQLVNKLYQNGFLTKPEVIESAIVANFRPSSKTS